MVDDKKKRRTPKEVRQDIPKPNMRLKAREQQYIYQASPKK